MNTEIHGASGYGHSINSLYYKVEYVHGTHDIGQSYYPSGQVKFYMKVRGGLTWQDVIYTNTCNFDRDGTASFSWF